VKGFEDFQQPLNSSHIIPREMNEKKMNPDRLEQYLNCERLLNEFFSQTDFCLENCIRLEKSLYVNRFESLPGWIGCCALDYYNSTSNLPVDIRTRLRSEQIRLYGEPKNKEDSIRFKEKTKKPCDYHTEYGCALKSHKAPLCIAWVCKDLKSYLHKTFYIDYNPSDVQCHLEAILTGKIDNNRYDRFIDKLIQDTDTLRYGRLLQKRSSVNSRY